MTPTVDGFAAKGLLLQLIPSAAGAIGTVVFVFVIYVIIRSFMKQAKATEGMTEDEIKTSLTWLNWARNGIIALVFFGFGWHTIGVIAINRTPTVDLDGSAVYKQMENNITAGQ